MRECRNPSRYMRSIWAYRAIPEDGNVKDWPRLKRLMTSLLKQLRQEIRDKKSWGPGYLAGYKKDFKNASLKDRIIRLKADLVYYSDRWGYGRYDIVNHAWNVILKESGK